VRAALLALLALGVLVAGAPAVAATTTPRTLPGGLARPASPDRPPRGWERSARDVLRIADRLPVVRAERDRAPGSTREAFLRPARRWQVSYYDERGGRRREIAQVHVDDATGAVLEQWTGFRVAWTMARGYPGAFGRAVGSAWIWIPLSVLFVLPFVDPRRPRRALHLDLAVLSAFSVAWALFTAAEVELSTPLAYPLLAYLLVRMLAVGLRRRAGGQPPEPLPLLVPTAWLLVGLVFLVGFRVGLNLTSSNVIDVGYAGVIGADRLLDGERLYGGFPSDNPHGDTYGPVTYLAYVPFRLALGWSGRWDDLPAAHGAALAFDLLAIVLLGLVGRRLRGPRLGIVLAYAWAAFPFTLLVANTNANDALVAVCLLAALLAASSPPARGALVAVAGLTKFAPLALAPLFAAHGGGRRGLLAFTVAFAATCALLALPVLLTGGDPATLWERTLGFQGRRDTPFSVWGLWDLPEAARLAVQALGVALALVVALVPRRGDVVGLAALSAAVLLALQLGTTYWFFLYLAWTFPLVMIALLGRHGEPLR
jgi:hypothetical protein